MPSTVLSPTVNEHTAPAVLLAQAVTGGGGTGGGGRHATVVVPGSAVQTPLNVLSPTVTEQVSPAFLSLLAVINASGGGGGGGRMLRSGPVGQVPLVALVSAASRRVSPAPLS